MGHHAQGKKQPLFTPLRLNREKGGREGRLAVILK